MLTSGTFSIEGVKPFPGYHNNDHRWNGWAVPYFEWDIAVKIVAWLNEWSGIEQLKVDMARKVVVDLEDPQAPFEIEGSEQVTVDGSRILFPIGSGWWIWDIHEE